LFLVTVDDFNHDKVEILAIDGRLSNLRINGSVSGSIHSTNISPDGIQPITFSANNNTNDKTNNDSRQQSGEEELATVKEKHPEYFVHTGHARVSPIWYKGKLWFALNVGCFVNDDIQSRSCIRIIEFDTNSSRRGMEGQ
jgi:hypothetical protein